MRAVVSVGIEGAADPLLRATAIGPRYLLPGSSARRTTQDSGPLQSPVHQSVSGVRFNGTPVGKGEVTAAMAGAQPIPTTLVTGDDVVCADMRAVIPDIETAVVKICLSRYAGHCLPLERTYALLKKAAYRALLYLDQRQPFVYEGTSNSHTVGERV